MPDRGALIEPLIPALRRYALALCRDPHLADDLVQDCLERALSNWTFRRPDGSVRSWLFAILHNGFISHYRKRANRSVHTSLYEHGAELPTPPGQDSALGVHDVLGALDTLPDDQRAVLLLIGIEDVSYAEAARILGVPLGTVMSRLSRGRERLRRAMDGERPASQGPMSLRRVK
jgi:RNA polymerase sigma-70 factor (ECF subfamily)